MTTDTQAIPTQELLKAVSNVFELKPGHRYILVFKEAQVSQKSMGELLTRLKDMGMVGLAIGLQRGQELDILELAPEEDATCS